MAPIKNALGVQGNLNWIPGCYYWPVMNMLLNNCFNVLCFFPVRFSVRQNLLLRVLKIVPVWRFKYQQYILARIQRGGGFGHGVLTPLPLKNQKKIRVSQQYWPGSPENSQSYQASIQCWAIIGQPAKRLLNGVLLAGR